MRTRAMAAGAGIGWLKDGVNLGRNNPRAIFGGAALILLSMALSMLVFGSGVAAVAVHAGATGTFSLMLAFMLVFGVLIAALTVGFLRLVDSVENGRPAAAFDVFAGFRDWGTTARAIGFAILLMVVQNLLLGLLLGLLAPEFGPWYLHNLQADLQGMQGVARAPAMPLPAGFARAMPVAVAVGMFSYAVQALGMAQIALRGRGVFGALADGVAGAARNLLPLLVMLLGLVAAAIVIALFVALVVLVAGILAKLAGAWLAVLLLVPLYLAFLLVAYVVMFGVMYAMWRGILGGDDGGTASPESGLEA